MGMNGQMKEFQEDIESRMGKAFKNKAGKNYGMSETDMILKRANSKSTFGSIREAMKEVDARASNNLKVNTRFLRRQTNL